MTTKSKEVSKEVKVKIMANALSEKTKSQKSFGKSFDYYGFSVKLTTTHWMAFHVDRGLIDGKYEDRCKFIDKYKPIAHSYTELGKGWDFYGEPTGNGQLGITVYTASGKAIAAGTGYFTKSGDFKFKVATLYKGITNRGKIEYKVEGTGKSDGSWQVTGSVSYTK